MKFVTDLNSGTTYSFPTAADRDRGMVTMSDEGCRPVFTINPVRSRPAPAWWYEEAS